MQLLQANQDFIARLPPSSLFQFSHVRAGAGVIRNPRLIIFSKGSPTILVRKCSFPAIQREPVSQFLNVFGKHHICHSNVVFPVLLVSLFVQPICSDFIKELAPTNSGSYPIHGSPLQLTARACRSRTPKPPVSTSRELFAANSAL